MSYRDKHAAAERVARQSVAVIAETDFLNDHGDALMDLAEVRRLAGYADEAIDVVQQALRLYRRKGNVVSEAAASRALEELHFLTGSGS